MTTTDDLKEAFAGESQANRRYLAFAAQADKEGYAQVAKLFRAAAQAETVHALQHLKVLGEILDTPSNIKAAISGETDEFQNMYPAMITRAQQEGNRAAEMSFSGANAVEEIHAGLFAKALEQLDRAEDVEYYICPVCGNTVELSAPERCPICNTAGDKFYSVG